MSDQPYVNQAIRDEHDTATKHKRVMNYGWDVGNARAVKLNVDSSGNLLSGIEIPTHDYIAITYPTSTTETYTYKTGGSGGTTVATITLTYTDSNKTDLSSAERT